MGADWRDLAGTLPRGQSGAPPPAKHGSWGQGAIWSGWWCNRDKSRSEPRMRKQGPAMDEIGNFERSAIANAATAAVLFGCSRVKR